MVNQLLEVFCEKELQKTSHEKFRKKKIIKRKGDKFYVRWIGYDDSFNNSWIKKKEFLQKLFNTFLNRLEILERTLTLKLIFLATQQKMI